MFFRPCRKIKIVETQSQKNENLFHQFISENRRGNIMEFLWNCNNGIIDMKTGAFYEGHTDAV